MNLPKIGGRLAVYGCDVHDPTGIWHVVKPGSFRPPQNYPPLTQGDSLCHRRVWTNGYAADHHFDGALCAACRERL